MRQFKFEVQQILMMLGKVLREVGLFHPNLVLKCPTSELIFFEACWAMYCHKPNVHTGHGKPKTV